MIIITSLVVVHSILSAWFNYEVINNKDWHNSQALSLLPLFLLPFSIEIDFSIANTIYLLVYMGALRWILFDLFLNWFRGMHWLYVGTGNMDKAFKEFQYIIKALLIFYIVVIFIQFYQYG